MPAVNDAGTVVYPVPRSFRLDDRARQFLQLLQEDMGISQADVVRVAIRELAERRGIKIKKATTSG